ncbi:MAG: hypothetical protein AAF497_03815 [Planctomycetota bacterium]
MSTKKKKKRKKTTAQSAEPAKTTPPIHDPFAGLRWQHEEQPSASNRDRAILATVLSVFSIWIIILAWLVWESLSQ